MTFFIRIKKAITNFEEYETFAKEKVEVGIIYFLKLLAIFIAIVTLSTFTYTEDISKFALLLSKNAIVYGLDIFIRLLILSLLGILISKIFRIKLKYKETLNISFYRNNIINYFIYDIYACKSLSWF